MLYDDQARRLAVKALQNGASHRVTRDGKTVLRHLDWKVSGNCSNPITVEQHSRPEKRGHKYVVLPAEGKHMLITCEVPCRKCDNCLKRRSHHWRLRSMSEYGQSARTWFATFTFKPEQQYRLVNLARRYCSTNGLDYEALPETERFALHAAEASKELTLFFKRLRKNSGSNITYLVVTEAHKSGQPHFHALIHEKDRTAPVKHKTLCDAWHLGFANFKLCADAKAASYVTKYLSKSMMARVRASLHYGQ